MSQNPQEAAKLTGDVPLLRSPDPLRYMQIPRREQRRDVHLRHGRVRLGVVRERRQARVLAGSNGPCSLNSNPRTLNPEP